MERIDPFIDLIDPRGRRYRCRIALGRGERRRGLIGVDRLAPDEALLLPNATSVHTFGMRCTIVVARLDADLRVVDVRAMVPRRLLGPRLRARHVLECAAEVDLRPGDALLVDARGLAGEERAISAPAPVRARRRPSRSGRA